MEVTVISGKGGTGKTTIVACLARLAENVVLADVDVDASNLHLLTTPQLRESHPFIGGAIATISQDKCIGCGTCDSVCRFNAIGSLTEKDDGSALRQVVPNRCEGCGFCKIVCPVNAVEFQETVDGNWFVSDTQMGAMAHAELGIAAENSGRLVTKVRKTAHLLADGGHGNQILNDGAPGTGCPVIASITGSDLVVIVTEPTVSGVHDLARVLALCDHFGIRSAVIINKVDLNNEQAACIEQAAGRHNVPVIGRIPFDPLVQQALMQGKILLDFASGPAADAIRQTWTALCRILPDSAGRVLAGSR